MLRSAALAATALLLLAAESYGIFVHRFGEVANPPAAGDVASAEIAGAVSLAQTFRMQAAGFDGIRVHARRIAGPVQGRIVADLMEIEPASGREVPKFQSIQAAQAVADAGQWLVRLPEASDSRGRLYRIRLSLPDASPGHGLAFVISRHDRWPEGRLSIGGRDQWGDLAFETHASRATIWANVAQTAGGPRSWRRWAAVVVVVMQAAAALALVCGLCRRRTSGEEPDPPA